MSAGIGTRLVVIHGAAADYYATTLRKLTDPTTSAETREFCAAVTRRFAVSLAGSTVTKETTP